MNVKNELKKIKYISNVVCRENGVLEIYSKRDVKNIVLRYLNSHSLDMCFIRVDFFKL